MTADHREIVPPQRDDVLRDSFGRVIDNLRISVTDRCNFRCQYCMPEGGMTWMAKDDLLTFEEIARLAGNFAQLGIRKIRLTGGEPLMRKEFSKLVAGIAAVRGIEDIAVTTNGYFLAEQGPDLVKAGLRRINISLDSLEPAKFEQIARRRYFEKVWKGIETVERLGIRPIKLNVVLIRGINDSEIAAFARLARTRPFIVRFIEFMPIGSDDGWTSEKVVPTHEVIARIEQELGCRLVAIEKHGAQPADRYRCEVGPGEFGFISSVSEPFCTHCNRVRITSDGKLRTCLFSLDETDLRAALRSGTTDERIRELIHNAVWRKEKGHLINQPGFIRPARTMSQIGG